MSSSKDFKVAIASGKGGTGKTTLAVNLALWLQKTMPVRLCDLDVEEPNSGLFLDLPWQKSTDVLRSVPRWLPDKCTYCGLCQRVCNFNAIIQTKVAVMVFEQLCHSCRACFDLCPSGALQPGDYKTGQINFYQQIGLEFVEGKMEVGREQAVPVISDILDYLAQNPLSEGITVIDSPPGTACPAMETFAGSDFVLIVTEPTPFGFYDAGLAVQSVQSLHKPVALVINKYQDEDRQIERFCQRWQIELLARIPLSKEIAYNYSQGRPIFVNNLAVQRSLQKIADYLEQLRRSR